MQMGTTCTSSCFLKEDEGEEEGEEWMLGEDDEGDIDGVSSLLIKDEFSESE